MTLELGHEGQPKTVTVHLGEAPATAGVTPSHSLQGGGGSGNIDGLGLQPPTPAMRDRFRIAQHGVVITAAEPGSRAVSTGLRPGDVGLEVPGLAQGVDDLRANRAEKWGLAGSEGRLYLS